MGNRLSDEIVKAIAESKTGRTYPHEGKLMAQEILEWREAARKAEAAKRAAAAAPGAGQPAPGGIYPFGTP